MKTMSLLEELNNDIRVLPDVKKAFDSLLNPPMDKAVAFGSLSWFDIVSVYDGEFLRKLNTSLPLITLYVYKMNNREWWIRLVMEVPCHTDKEETASPDMLFRQSRFAPYFDKEYVSGGVMIVTKNFGKDTESAMRLISYYLGYYDYKYLITDCNRYDSD